ncbi:hypothetical protein X375_05835 [Oenococcus oeni S13]|uniref:glycosyltransferase family 4 protein n=1 Tax=Oenococcus oeni TaxID=1247 RepID=UPI00050E9575|nr:glycosyltransferase family 4 protein [Oenococcus oeni]KGH62267.1 hypothetical protein X375_05835 [Oenococcus oeni S13]
MKIGYISPTNPFTDKKTWSGTYYNTRKALEHAGHEVEWIRYDINGLRDVIGSHLYGFYNNRRKVLYSHSRIASRLRTNSIKTNFSNYDLIFVPGQSEIVAALRTNVPIVYYSDATVPLMVNYYWFNLPEKAIIEAKIVERRAILNSTYCLFASEWAANSAIRDYGADFERTKVFPFGANIDNHYIKSTFSYRRGEVLKILFSGVEWNRKGGKIAVDAVENLNRRGIKSELTLCGINNLPSYVNSKSFIHNVGFLNKNNKNELKEYSKIWEGNNLLLVPTRAECAGIVFSEAAAYGIPIVSTDTGGVSTYVLNGVNGQRLPLKANGSEYADVIENWVQTDQLNLLGKGSRNLYETQNNWETWGKRFNRVIFGKEN